jgi:hypothetical protein
MSLVQLGKAARLRSQSNSPFPLILLLESVRFGDPAIVMLSDRCEEVACYVTRDAERKVQEGLIRPGDIVSIVQYQSEGERVVVEAMERLARYSLDYLIFSQVAQRVDKEYVNVQVRVVAIGKTRPYTSKFGPKLFFNLAILDQTGAEIIVSFFNQEAIQFDKFFQLGECYKFRDFRIDRDSPKSTAQFRCSLSADKQSSIQRISLSLPQASFSLLSFEALKQVQLDSIVDVVGVLTVIGDLSDRGNRIISLVNSLNQKIEVTLWGALAEDDYGGYRGLQPIVVVKRVQVKGSQNLSVLEGLSELLFNVAGLKQAEQLQRWKASLPTEPDAYIPIQRPVASVAVVPRSLATDQVQASIKELIRISTEQGWGQKLALIASIQQIECKPLDNAMYSACTRSGCLKGVTQDENGVYNCSKCRHEATSCTYRYILRMTLCDDQKDEVKVTAFDFRAMELVGITAANLRKLGEEAAVERLGTLIGQSKLWTLSRNERNFHLSQSYIVDSIKSSGRECGIE